MALEHGCNAPVRLDNARAWRTYLGGKMLDEFHGCDHGDDGHFPEEWVTSLVAARNAGREDVVEGISRIYGEDTTLQELVLSAPSAFLGERHVKKLGVTMGVLVKLIDSAERLAVQVHPDREKARELFQSNYGKTECWHILGGREINGEQPSVYLGFREGITRERWMELFKRQDIQGMLGCMHRFFVEPGDTILIEGGVPHAIGAGCFLVEIQEPTDYTIRVERTTPSGYRVEDVMCHQGLGFERMFDCFHYDGLSREETRRRWFLKRRPAAGYRGGEAETLVGYEDTPFFRMNILTVPGDAKQPVIGQDVAESGAGDSWTVQQELHGSGTGDCSGLYVLEGEGEMTAGVRSVAVRQGEQYFLPAGIGELRWRAGTGGNLKMIQFFGPCLD